MKNTTFEHTLKTLTNGVEIEVNQHQFNRVMELRANKKKRKKLLWWFGATAVVFIVATLTYLNFQAIGPNKQPLTEAGEQQNTTSVKKEITVNNSITKHKNKNTTEQPYHQPKQEEQVLNPSNAITLIHSKNRRMGAIQTKHTSYFNQPQANIDSAAITGMFLASNLNQMMSLNRPQMITPPVIKNQLTLKNRILSPMDDTLLSWSKPFAKKRAFKGIYLNASYFPFTAAKNTSSLLPEQKAEMVGLSEDANYAYSINGGLIYNLNNNTQLLAGVGIHTLQFDKIRTVDIKVDTNFESLTSGVSYNNFEHVADLSFTWLNIPVAVRYTKPISNKLGAYLQAGLQYRYLLQHKSYVFTVDSNALESYAVKNNYSSNRINKHQLALTIEPGLMYNITPKLALTLGLPYQQDLFSIYNKKYAERSPAKLFGVKAGIEINF
jgi:opacity protein-like surface antigen